MKCRIMQCSVFNCCCRRCRRSLRCLRISLITRLFYNLFVIGINIYVLWLLIEWLTEPRRIKPIVSFENEINPEGFRLYFAGGILMTLTAGVAIIIQSFLIHYMRDDVYRYRANDATEFTRAVTESPFYFAILSVDLCIAFTNLLLSVGLFFRELESCETDFVPLWDDNICSSLSSFTVYCIPWELILEVKQILLGVISLIKPCKNLLISAHATRRDKQVLRCKALLSFEIPQVILECLSFGLALYTFCFFITKTPVCEMNTRVSTNVDCYVWHYKCWSSNQIKMDNWTDSGERCWFFKQNSTNQWPAVPGSEEPWVANFQASQMNSNFTASSNVSDDTWVRWGLGWKFERKSTTMFNSTFCSSYLIIEEVEISFPIQAKNFLAIIFTLRVFW